MGVHDCDFARGGFSVAVGGGAGDAGPLQGQDGDAVGAVGVCFGGGGWGVEELFGGV